MPNPEPLGTCVTSVSKHIPQPILCITSSIFLSLSRITPLITSADFSNINSSFMLPQSFNSSMFLNSFSIFKSMLLSIILLSFISFTLHLIGNLPFNKNAAFNTLPPFSLQYGGVSDHPPPKLTLIGISTVLSFRCLLLIHALSC